MRGIVVRTLIIAAGIGVAGWFIGPSGRYEIIIVERGAR